MDKLGPCSDDRGYTATISVELQRQSRSTPSDDEAGRGPRTSTRMYICFRAGQFTSDKSNTRMLSPHRRFHQFLDRTIGFGVQAGQAEESTDSQLETASLSQTVVVQV
jgi:site-specific recombinase XerD